MVCMIILFVTSQKPILNSETTYALSFYKSKTILDMSKLFGKEVQIVSLYERFIPFSFFVNDEKRKKQLYCLCLKMTADFGNFVAKNDKKRKMK